jgi:hypothetical protein
VLTERRSFNTFSNKKIMKFTSLSRQKMIFG